MTLPEIGAFFFSKITCSSLGSSCRLPRKSISDSYSDDVILTNLANWHIFEIENPATFSKCTSFGFEAGIGQ